MSGYSGVGKSSVLNELSGISFRDTSLFRVMQIRPAQTGHPVCDTPRRPSKPSSIRFWLIGDAEVSHWQNALREGVG
jgi:hypothetical protein